jgi:hypothetical protein
MPADSDGAPSSGTVVTGPPAESDTSPPAVSGPAPGTEGEAAASTPPSGADRQPIVPRGRSRITPRSSSPQPRGDVQPVSSPKRSDPGDAGAPDLRGDGHGGAPTRFVPIEPGHENDDGPRTLVLIVPGQGL